jgi:S-adenosylmethionine hydrolase
VKTRRGEGEMMKRGDRKPRLSISPSARLPVITLLTDFGTADYFVGALKGVILSTNERASLVDITHEIPAHDVESAAFTLLASYRSFPSQTIHVAVVDPGVGSARRPIFVKAGEHFFVGPDNGIFSYIYESEPQYQTFQITNESYFRHPVSTTFHGRDVFAPVAAALSLGANPAEFGPEIKNEVRLASLRPVEHKNGKLEGRIIHIDRFGNCITNFTREHLAAGWESRVSLQVSGKTIRSFRSSFSDETSGSGKLFAIWGSAGFLEIAATSRSAAKLLLAKRGQAVILRAKV